MLRSDHHRLGAAARWLNRRHGVKVEALLLLGLYAAYDTSRGLVSTSRRIAVAHGTTIHDVERLVHIDAEPTVQRLAGEVPGVMTLCSLTYTVCHLGVTIAVLAWLYRSDATAFVRIRQALLLASLIALLGFLVWPAAPPRLDGVGLTNGISSIGVNLESHALTLLYNPYAAFPSLHEAYAVLAGFALWRWSTRPWIRAVGVVYPAWVAAEVVATGNHFFLDVAAGALVAVAALAVTARHPAAPTEVRSDTAGLLPAAETRPERQRSPANRSSSGVAAPVRSKARTKLS